MNSSWKFVEPYGLSLEQVSALVGKTVSVVSSHGVDRNNEGIYYSVGKVVSVTSSSPNRNFYGDISSYRTPAIEIETGETEPSRRLINIREMRSFAVHE